MVEDLTRRLYISKNRLTTKLSGAMYFDIEIIDDIVTNAHRSLKKYSENSSNKVVEELVKELEARGEEFEGMPHKEREELEKLAYDICLKIVIERYNYMYGKN